MISIQGFESVGSLVHFHSVDDSIVIDIQGTNNRHARQAHAICATLRRRWALVRLCTGAILQNATGRGAHGCLALGITTGASTWWAITLVKTNIRFAPPHPWDKRELSADAVIIGTLRKFWSDAKAAVALIQITAVFDEFKILSEVAIIISTWAVCLGRSRTFFQLVARLHFS